MRLDRLEDSIETYRKKIDDCKFRDVITMKSSSIHRTIEIDNHFDPFFCGQIMVNDREQERV